jgi:hypothetical protein
MFLKATIGRYAGEIREYSPEAAQALLKNGRAVNPFAPVEAKTATGAESPAPRAAVAPRNSRSARRYGRN